MQAENSWTYLYWMEFIWFDFLHPIYEKLRIFAKFSLHGKLIHYIVRNICNICKINVVLRKFLSYLIKNAQIGLQWQQLFVKMLNFSAFYFVLTMTTESQELKLSKLSKTEFYKYIA